MKKNKIVWIVLFGSMLYTLGCSKAILDDGDVAPITSATYSADVAPLITANCVTCHSGPTPSAGLSLTDYDKVKFAAENRNLIARINDSVNPMPQSGLMPAQQRQTIEKWVNDGFPQ